VVDDVIAKLEALDARVQALEDELAITRTVVEYGFAVDAGNAPATGVLYTEDTVFDLEITTNRVDAMSHLEAVEGNPQKAIEYGERGIAIKLDPATLGTIGDAYAAIGNRAQAEDYYKTMEVAVAGQPGAYHRAWSLFLLDHDREHRRHVSASRCLPSRDRPFPWLVQSRRCPDEE